MRIGQLAEEPIQIVRGSPFTLTTQDIVGDAGRASMTFARLPQVVKPGDKLFLNDGIIQLEVERVDGAAVHCRVLVGGELRSRERAESAGHRFGHLGIYRARSGVLEICPRTWRGRRSQSFVELAADIHAVREAARSFGGSPWYGQDRGRGAPDHIDEILSAADGIMVVRGDLGVETPIERIAILQKALVKNAVRRGNP